MQVIDGKFGQDKERTPIRESILNALEETGMGGTKDADWLLAVEGDEGLLLVTNQNYGDVMLSLELIKTVVLKTYTEQSTGD